MQRALALRARGAQSGRQQWAACLVLQPQAARPVPAPARCCCLTLPCCAAALPSCRFGIIVPLAPFGNPDYDQTERFDLRLPFVDQGDPDPELENDPLGLKQLGKAFGFGKKKKDQK
ncbi:hypothetical protein ABPG75_001716 [Micractinium tetrahymenae]